MIQINTLKGFEAVKDIYFITEQGEVFSTFKGGYLLTKDNGHGYLIVTLKLEGVRKWKHAYIHRLVALAYIPNPDGKSEVNHIDEDKQNNEVGNLEWVTRLTNVRHGTGIQRAVRKRCQDVFVYDHRLVFQGKFIGMHKATLATLGYSETKGRNRRRKGFFFLDCPIEQMSRDEFLAIVDSSLYKSVIVENIKTGEQLFFEKNRDARRFFDGKVNITDAIKNSWLIRGTYRAYNLDYARLIDSPNLREQEP